MKNHSENRMATRLSATLKVLGGDLIHELGWRLPLLMMAKIVSALLEGVGLALLLPLLSRFAGGQGGQPSALGRWMSDGLATVGLGQTLEGLLLVLIAAVACQHAFYLAASWLLAQCKSMYMAAWRVRLFARIYQARWRFFAGRQSGRLANTLLEDTSHVAQLLHEVGHIFDSGILVTVYIVLAFASAWPVALVIIGFGSLMFLITSPILRSGLRTGAKIRSEADTLHSIVIEFLAGAKFIKSTASEARAEEVFSASVRAHARMLRATTFHTNVIRSVYELVAVLLLSVCLWIGVSVFKIDFGSIILSVYLFLRIYQRLSLIQQSVQLFQTQRPAFDAAWALYREAEQEAEAVNSNANDIESPDGAGGVEISLRGVMVDYDGRPALRGASLDLPQGHIIGIAGPSGAGKSTLVDCVLGLVPVDKGSITIGGRLITELSLNAWRRSVGYVAQETFLFNTSIKENIRWAHPEAIDEDVERAARQAHAEEFIRMLPNGFDTEVGERGVRLSGGQRQRIGLARALVGRVRLLVLDEATSALDSEAEKIVLEAINELRGQMTVVIVAHRLSTLRGADRLYLLESGKIVESGRWEELIEAGTRFSDFWKLQSQEQSAVAVE